MNNYDYCKNYNWMDANRKDLRDYYDRLNLLVYDLKNGDEEIDSWIVTNILNVAHRLLTHTFEEDYIKVPEAHVYEVRLELTLISDEYLDVEVEAYSKEEAKALAIAMYNNGEVDMSEQYASGSMDTTLDTSSVENWQVEVKKSR